MRVIEHPVPGQEPLQLGYEIYWPGLQEFAGQGDIEFDALTRVRAMQVTNMMGYVKTGFYEAPEPGGLGLQWIEDALYVPNINSQAHMNWRIEGLRLASRRLVGAYLLDGGKPSVEVDALVGMLILDQQPSSGDGGGPAPVEIVELDTRRGYQRLGVASRLLGIGALLTHPDTPLVLDVAEGNGSAQTFYAARGFRFDPGLRYDHGVYNTLHIGMRTDARTLVQNPRINRGPDLSWGVLPENKAAALP